MADETAAAAGDADASLAWARALLGGLVSGGISQFVISPGSRSTPLALAAELDPRIRSWVLPDERSAAFMALGLARGSGRPAGLIGTSGTAVANWLPAVVESDADCVPMVVVSADRPPELHDTGANQTIRQDDLFGSRVRMRFSLAAYAADGPDSSYPETVGLQAAQRADWPEPGPVHINAMFREPLVPTRLPEPMPADALPEASHRPRVVPASATIAAVAGRLQRGRTLIVAGRLPPDPGLPVAMVALAARLNCPILADPLSGLRWGTHDLGRIVATYDTFLRSPRHSADLRPDTVLQFGAAPTSRVLQQFIAQTKAELWLAAPSARWADPDRQARRCLAADPGPLAQMLLEHLPTASDSAWLERWRSAEADGRTLVTSQDCRPLEAGIIRMLETRLPLDAPLFIGNSMPVRLLDTFGTGGDRPIRVFGNRGASGIDGNIATLAGLANGTATQVVGLIGDLALVHDMNGLLALRDCDATLVVINNGGGGIFDLLPQRELDSFERLWLTPTGLEPEKIAGLFGIRHRRCATPDMLEAALDRALRTVGADLLEVTVDRETSSRALRALWDRAAASSPRPR